ncbi:MAG: leucine-rich repeat protein, partial [Lachnospiraceae bacterium]|nr:leucine-rich repeat protein [Lachnospiraceae bacterium]
MAFYECKSLQSITLPDSVSSIGRSAFGNCSGLKSIVIPGDLTTMGY